MLRNNINIGELDTLVEIQSCVITKGDMGQKKYSFTHHSKVWAKVERNINEGVDNLNLEASHDLEVTIYKIKELTTRWRVIIGKQPYEIVSIDSVSRFSPLCIVGLSAIDG